MSESRLLEAVSAYAAEFLPSLADRPVGPSAAYDELMRASAARCRPPARTTSR